MLPCAVRFGRRMSAGRGLLSRLTRVEWARVVAAAVLHSQGEQSAGRVATKDGGGVACRRHVLV